MRRTVNISEALDKALLKVVDKDEWLRYIIDKRWKDVVGEKVAKKVKVKAFKDGLLEIVVKDSAYRNEIVYFLDNYKNALNRIFGRGTVKEIKVRGSEGRWWRTR